MLYPFSCVVERAALVVVTNQWIMPNDSTATSKALDNFIVSLQEIQERTGYEPAERLERSQSAQPDSWDKKECDRLGLIDWQS